MNFKALLPSAVIIIGLGACATSPELETKEVIIPPVPIKTCTPISKLTKVDIPAETETYYAITEIENPPYEPIQRKETLTRVVKEAQIIYVNDDGQEVTDICEEQVDDEASSSATN